MKYILKRPTTALALDPAKKIALGTFIGDVSFSDYKEMLLAAAELTRSGKIDSIIMDRRKIDKLDAECRIWVKNEYLKVHIKPLIPMMRKVAVIQSKSILGQIYGQAIYKTFSMIYPNLSFKSFSKLSEAMDWLKPKEEKGTMLVEDFIESKEVKTTQESKPKSSVKRNYIQKDIQEQKELAIAGEDKKESTSFFDKVFNMLFSN